MKANKMLNVWMGGRKVGRLAETPDHLAAFEYDAGWLQNGFPISPISLPLQKGVFVPKGYEPFEGIFGVFADSLPDGWGRLLVDRMLRKEGSYAFRQCIIGNIPQNSQSGLSYSDAAYAETDE